MITRVLVSVTGAQPADAAMVLVTVYVPGTEAAMLTAPVAVLTKTSPAVDENVPATPPPMKAGDGLAAVEQKGVPG